MATQVESWDDDGDLQGDFFASSVSTIQTSMSSRMSVHSESNAGDEDWQVLLTPNDESSTLQAISSAKQAGIPIPNNVPATALLGGTIKRLGGPKKSRPRVEDDWTEDIQLDENPAGLQLKLQLPKSTPPQAKEEDDDFDLDWGEGSLGIRYGGTTREVRNRSSSVSAFSPSLVSCGTLESEQEDDEFAGLSLPMGPVDFNEKLRKRQERAHHEPELTSPPNEPILFSIETSPLPPPSITSIPSQQNSPFSLPSVSREVSPAPIQMPLSFNKASPKRLQQNEEDEDFEKGFDLGGNEELDLYKPKVNENLKVETKPKPRYPSRSTTMTFTDKAAPSSSHQAPPATRIPRLTSAARPTGLAPVLEPGATNITQPRRLGPASNQPMLRNKRSAPVLRGDYGSSARTTQPPFRPSGNAEPQRRVGFDLKPKTLGVPHSRTNSDATTRTLSPPPRSSSRLASHITPDTPTRPRRDLGIPSSRRPLQKPTRRHNFGDGTELERFDDLPTSATKEAKFVKEPIAKGAPRTLRHQISQNRLPSQPERTMTPMPTPITPRSPVKMDLNTTPRFARDTAASRIAREQRLKPSVSHTNLGHPPFYSTFTNRSTSNLSTVRSIASPVANRSLNPPLRTKKLAGPPARPKLLTPAEFGVQQSQKEMTWDENTNTWQGNDASLHIFEKVTPKPAQPDPQVKLKQLVSPPRAQPGLIAALSATSNELFEKGMWFDNRQMCWIRAEPDPNNASYKPVGEEDPFADIPDLPEEPGAVSAVGPVKPANASAASAAQSQDAYGFGEEFDLGPAFIRRQFAEEDTWKDMVFAWRGSLEPPSKPECLVHEANRAWCLKYFAVPWAEQEAATGQWEEEQRVVVEQYSPGRARVSDPREVKWNRPLVEWLLQHVFEPVSFALSSRRDDSSRVHQINYFPARPEHVTRPRAAAQPSVTGSKLIAALKLLNPAVYSILFQPYLQAGPRNIMVDEGLEAVLLDFINQEEEEQTLVDKGHDSYEL